MCVAVTGNSTQNGAKMYQYPCDGSSGQGFKFTKVDGAYYIANVVSNKDISSPHSKQDDGIQLIQWDRADQSNRKWYLALDRLGGREVKTCFIKGKRRKSVPTQMLAPSCVHTHVSLTIMLP